MDFTKVEKALRGRGFAVSVFQTKEEAASYLNTRIDGTSVGFGGSVTMRQMGLYDSLGAHNQVWSHWDGPEGKTEDEIRGEAARTEVYLSSVNGLAETGELINIDGTGNRAAGTMYGHKRVFLVVGRNKLAPTYDDALWRARNIAGPKNAVRLNRKTPCAVRGDRCYDCKSPDRICRGLVVLWGPMRGSETEVVLINEDLGY